MLFKLLFALLAISLATGVHECRAQPTGDDTEKNRPVALSNYAVDEFSASWTEEAGASQGGGNLSNATGSCKQQKSTWVGYVFTAVAVFLFGTCYLATKQVDLGDGMFYQWVFCSAVVVCGVIVNGIKSWPPFQPLAMIGGLTFATGNVTVVPIIKMIGIGMGILFWGMVNLTVGWASARFGILGVDVEAPCSSLLNYLGILFCALALFTFLFVKSEGTKSPTTHSRIDERKPLLNAASSGAHLQDEGKQDSLGTSNGDDIEEMWTDKLTPGARRTIGYLLAVFAGLCYGVMFNPVTHLQQNKASDESGDTTAGLRYTFSHFTGIYLTSTFYFVVYAIYMRGAPRLYPKAVLPGILSGTMWAIACSSWFVANDLLSQAIAFPIMATGPAIIASLFGIILYKEISGRRNLGFFGCAIFFTIVGVALTGLSKVYST